MFLFLLSPADGAIWDEMLNCADGTDAFRRQLFCWPVDIGSGPSKSKWIEAPSQNCIHITVCVNKVFPCNYNNNKITHSCSMKTWITPRDWFTLKKSQHFLDIQMMIFNIILLNCLWPNQLYGLHKVILWPSFEIFLCYKEDCSSIHYPHIQSLVFVSFPIYFPDTAPDIVFWRTLKTSHRFIHHSQTGTCVLCV